MKSSSATPPADESFLDAPACVRLLRAIGAEETDVKRRELLFELALVLGGSKALNLLRVLTLDEEERLAGVLRSTWRVDEASVSAFEKLAMQAHKADDRSGPATLLPVVTRQREAIGRLLARESMLPSLRDRLLSTYAKMSQLAGFLAYDLCDYPAAEQPLRDGLRAALDAGDATSAGYLHYWLGRVAADQDRTGAVLDHAFAVQGWSARSSSKLLAPLHQSLFSVAHAAAGDTVASARAAEGFLTRLDPKYKRRHGLVLTRYASALTMAKEIPEAAAKLEEAADITRQHSSARLVDEIRQARARLDPWTTTTYVRRLDETLRSSGLTSAGPAARA